ncbi:class I SAM-dependent methyltransferase [Niveibacterium sp. SC-1]|uniref:class I SAM-dependent methyltransferase n=1 Tax=Niveibacterium sp. SC-1 TaxID=3135646 RepID=UPI00311E236A
MNAPQNTQKIAQHPAQPAQQNAPLFQPAPMSAMQARYEAQRIAFSPVVFQCVRIAWKRGILAALAASGRKPLSTEVLAEQSKLSTYAAGVLLETSLSAGVVTREGDDWLLGKSGHWMVSDALTQINFDFVNDVCYLGLADLEESLVQGKPIGLRALGDWETIYQGLSILPEPARTSWFRFDHYYSDSAFPAALPHVMKLAPRRLMDIGANTGKWTRMCLERDPALQVTMLDLPIQLEVAQRNLAEAGLAERAIAHPIDLLDVSAAFPEGQDVVWMSQFLCCFSEEVIRSILARARACLAPGGRILVLDTFWDRQAHEIAAFCLVNTSPYFTALGSGVSKMYESGAFIEAARDVGLRLADVRDGLGIAHSLLSFEAE